MGGDVRASFDVCLRREAGGGESYTREPEEGEGRGLLRGRFKALKEWRGGDGPREEGGWGGDLALHS